MVQISAAEAVVMEILWRNHPLAADEVVAALADRDWAEATVKTLLNRLLNKGAIGAEKDGRRYLYSPQVAREDWVLEDPAAMDVDGVRVVRDQIEAKVRALMTSVGVEPPPA